MAKLYIITKFILVLFIVLSFSGCNEQTEISLLPVEIIDDTESVSIDIEIGTTVQTVLTSNDINLSPLDKVNPPVFTVITEPLTITITRVEEQFETEETIIPFEQQTVRNEALPERQTILIQPGVNGIQEITYRLLYENGQLFSRTEVRRTNIVEPKPEIVMIGVQSPFTSIPINGKMVYLSSGNAWMIENQTSNRVPVITNGKLDGRILSLSSNGKWLLYSQVSNDEEKINELWVKNLEDDEAEPVYLKTDNVIHFAEWKPGLVLSVIVSTVEPREVAPGWQANNNLIELTLGADGNVLRTKEILESNSGGIYGWWGTNFKFSPDGNLLAFIRPDALGFVDIDEETSIILSSITPYQTKSDWAWISPISWSPDNRFIYWVNHREDTSLENPELSPLFDLQAIDVDSNQIVTTRKNIGMFGYSTTIVSPVSNNKYYLAFLEAIFPENSESSRYRLKIIDRDGSNSQIIFPFNDMQGLEPQNIFTSPCDDQQSCQIGFIYQGNLWIVTMNEQINIHQITGDGLLTRIEWK